MKNPLVSLCAALALPLLSTGLALIPITLSVVPAEAAQSCPKGFRTEKLNQTYTCRIAASVIGSRQDGRDLKDKIRSTVDAAFANCDIPITPPIWLFGEARDDNGPIHTSVQAHYVCGLK